MSSVVALRLVAIFAVIGLGWLAGRVRLLGPSDDAARLLSNATFTIFTPALLFRTTARIDLAALPWTTLAAFFGPVVALLLAVYLARRGRTPDPAAASVQAICVSFGNTVQLGVPVVAALFGEQGLALHIAIVSLHALVLLTVLTVLVEADLARARTGGHPPSAALTVRTLRTVARRTVVHPVVLPVLAGLAWNLLALPLPGPADQVLQLLGQAVVPLSLVTIGLSLQQYGVAGSVGPAVALSAGKLLVQPALVLVAARWGAGLTGVPLHVVVLAAALPIGTNALLFAQRYRSQEARATAGIVVSTSVYAVTLPLWLVVLDTLGRSG